MLHYLLVTLPKIKKPKKWHFLFAAIALAGGLLLWQKIFTPNQHAQAQAQVAPKPPFAVNPTWPDTAAAAAMGVEGYGVVASHGAQQKRPIASIAKVITALTILDKHPLKMGEEGPSIPITEQDEQLYRDYVAKNGTVVLVKARTSLTLHQALEAMLLPSANNVADTAATWAFGSIEDYHKAARDMLKKYDLKDTVVGGDASGLNPATQSTASDLVKLGEKALQNPVIAQIVSQPSAEIPIAGVVPNYNAMVTKYGFSGIKPGESIEASNTLLFSAKHTIHGKAINIIGAVLGTDSYKVSNAAALDLMASLRKNIDDAGAQ